MYGFEGVVTSACTVIFMYNGGTALHKNGQTFRIKMAANWVMVCLCCGKRMRSQLAYFVKLITYQTPIYNFLVEYRP